MVVFSWMKIKGAKTQITELHRRWRERTHLSFVLSWLKVTLFDAFETLCDHTQVNMHFCARINVCAGASWEFPWVTWRILFWLRVSSTSFWLCPLLACLLVFSFTSVELPPRCSPLIRWSVILDYTCQFQRMIERRSSSTIKNKLATNVLEACWNTKGTEMSLLSLIKMTFGHPIYIQSRKHAL